MFIVLLATILGVITSAGGGSIINPVFDLIGIDNVSTIAVYSTIAVFSMCLSSLYKHANSGNQFDKIIMLLLATGSLTGGCSGDKILSLSTQTVSNSKVISSSVNITIFILLGVLLFTINREIFPRYKIRSKIVIFIFGLLVGTLSVFIGIGGGPLNVIVLLGFMSMTAKESTAYSIAMIFFLKFQKLLAYLY